MRQIASPTFTSRLQKKNLFQNHPIGLAGIFFQHLQLSRRLASHYSPLYLLGRVLVGELHSSINAEQTLHAATVNIAFRVPDPLFAPRRSRHLTHPSGPPAPRCDNGTRHLGIGSVLTMSKYIVY